MHPRITNVLDHRKVPHLRHLHSSFPQPVKSHHDLAQALGYELLRFTKTLFLHARGPGVFCLAVAPACIRRIDLEEIAAALKVTRLSLAPKEEITKQLDYAVAGVSPLACGHLPVFVDSPLLRFPTIIVGSGAEGEGLEIAPSAIVELTGAKVLALT